MRKRKLLASGLMVGAKLLDSSRKERTRLVAEEHARWTRVIQDAQIRIQ